jgi:hypothetical protein
MEDKIDQNKTSKLTFPKGRVFVFIDETGDPGDPSNKSSSRYFQLNIIVIHRESLHVLNKHLSAFRYFKNSGKELKRHNRDLEILTQIFIELASVSNVLFSSFIINKENYFEDCIFNFTPNNLRNFIIKISLEYIFNKLTHIDSESNNIEIVFDRYLESEKDEYELKQYLRGNYKLPKFDKIVQVDSEYSDSLQASDFLGKFVKDCFIDKNIHINMDILNLIRVFNVENNNIIKAKSAQDTQ